MLISIGDVVRDRSDGALGTVAGVMTGESGKCLTLKMPTGQRREAARLVWSSEVQLVGRYVRPTTTTNGLVSLLVLVLAFLGTVLAVAGARDMGANWAISLLTGLGGFTAVMTAYDVGLKTTGPKQFRI